MVVKLCLMAGGIQKAKDALSADATKMDFPGMDCALCCLR